MIIDRNLNQYVIFHEESVKEAVHRIVEHHGRILCATDEHNKVLGIITNGDILRWLSRQQVCDLHEPIAGLLNTDFVFAYEEEDIDEIKAKLEKVVLVPILDRHNRLKAMARERDEMVRIGSFVISENSPTFVIAEIGINHNGSLERAKALVDVAVNAGADCAKFQMRNLEALYSNAGNPNDTSENLGSQYTLDLLNRFQLTNDEMFDVFDYCKDQGIMPLCTPWDTDSLAVLEQYGMQAYKVASADLTNHFLLEALAKTGKPLICSTGMSSESEIIESVQLLQRLGAQYVLLHCNSTYPAPFKDIHLLYIQSLAEIGNCPVGYSGHERGIHIAIAAVAQGARVIEKHITFDRTMEGNDHKVSLLPDELENMIVGIRQVEEALGSSQPRELSQGERMNRANLAKSLVINRDLKVGEIITAAMIEVKSPGRGLQPNRLADLIGRPAKHGFKAGDFFYPNDIADETVLARDYHLKRSWGIPVRYYDYQSLLVRSNPDILEFHLSYKDMEQDLHQFFDQEYDLDFVVHSPDLFPGDHLLDLAAEDETYRRRSLDELQRVVAITRDLKRYFKKSTRPLVIASLGGFSQNSFVDPTRRRTLYARIADSLAQIDQDGVEIIAQTLPPFPWYFGGQLYLNLFVDPTDTAEFCETYNYRLCFDVSHSKLACNHFNWSFRDFVQRIGGHIAHLHLVDAAGVDSEGLQIGEGDIDFSALADQLDRIAPQASFIPEIWQGHENNGEGFWIALDRLEQWFGL